MKEQQEQRSISPKKATGRTIEQMVDGIVGKPKANAFPQEQQRQAELRRQLTGRAMEALMFMDDDV